MYFATPLQKLVPQGSTDFYLKHAKLDSDQKVFVEIHRVGSDGRLLIKSSCCCYIIPHFSPLGAPYFDTSHCIVTEISVDPSP